MPESLPTVTKPVSDPPVSDPPVSDPSAPDPPVSDAPATDVPAAGRSATGRPATRLTPPEALRGTSGRWSPVLVVSDDRARPAGRARGSRRAVDDASAASGDLSADRAAEDAGPAVVPADADVATTEEPRVGLAVASDAGAQAMEYAMLTGAGVSAVGLLGWLVRQPWFEEALRTMFTELMNMLTERIGSLLPMLAVGVLG